jgi:hypothetical protein
MLNRAAKDNGFTLHGLRHYLQGDGLKRADDENDDVSNDYEMECNAYPTWKHSLWIVVTANHSSDGETKRMRLSHGTSSFDNT